MYIIIEQEMYSLRVSIQGFYESFDSSTFYTIVVVHQESSVSWVCNRKLSEFHDLHKSLSLKFSSVPAPPGLSTLSSMVIFFTSPIPGLDSFLQSLLSLPEIYACEDIQSFFSIHLHIHSVLPPTLLATDQQAIFAVDTNPSMIGHLQQYAKTIGYPGSEMSVVHCLCRGTGWEVSLADRVTCMCWSSHLTILALGLDTGVTVFYRVKTEEDYAGYEEFSRKDVHYGAVVAVKLDYKSARVLSCGDDARLVVNSLSEKYRQREYQLNFVPVAMEVQWGEGVMYMASAGDLHVFDIEMVECIRVVRTGVAGEVTSMSAAGEGRIVVGGSRGDVVVVDRKGAVERRMNMAAAVCCVRYSEEKEEVVAADRNGVVGIWKISGEAVFKWRPHNECTCVDLNNGKIITAGSDGVVKMWVEEGGSNIRGETRKQ